MPYKEFLAGTEGLASDVNTYLMNQSVMTFADATARNTALPTPTEGMCAYLTTPDHFQIYNNTSGWVTFDTKWNAYTPTITGVGTSTVNAYYWRVGMVVHFMVYAVVSGAPTGLITVGTPLTSSSVTRQSAEVRFGFGASTFFGKGIFASSGTTVQVYALNVGGTYASATATSSTVPSAWVAGNTFLITGTYETS